MRAETAEISRSGFMWELKCSSQGDTEATKSGYRERHSSASMACPNTVHPAPSHEAVVDELGFPSHPHPFHQPPRPR